MGKEDLTPKPGEQEQDDASISTERLVEVLNRAAQGAFPDEKIGKTRKRLNAKIEEIMRRRKIH